MSGRPAIPRQFRQAAGRVFLHAREAAGLSLKDAAQRTGWSAPTLSKIESGWQPVSLHQLFAMAETYKIAGAELVRRVEQLWNVRDLLQEMHR